MNHYGNILIPFIDLFHKFILWRLLKSGQLLTGKNVTFVGMNNKPQKLLTEKDTIDADSLNGHSSSDFVLKSEYTPVDLSGYLQTSVADTRYARINHTHTPASIGAAAENHTHTPSSIGAAAASHTHTANQITGGTFAGNVMATTSGVMLTLPGVRNIYANTTDLTAGSSELGTGVVYLVYE